MAGAFCKNGQIDGKTYYGYTVRSEQDTPYDTLIETLRGLELTSGVPVFDTITVTTDQNEHVSFYMKTMEIPVEILEKSLNLTSVPEKWLILTVEATLPGTITNVNFSDPEGLGGRTDTTACYTVSNFAKSQTFYVHSYMETPSAIPFAIIGAVICGLIVVLICVIGKSQREEKERQQAE